MGLEDMAMMLFAVGVFMGLAIAANASDDLTLLQWYSICAVIGFSVGILL